MSNFLKQNGRAVVLGVVAIGAGFFFLRKSPGSDKKPTTEVCVARVQGTCIEPRQHRAAFRVMFSHGVKAMAPQSAPRFVLEGLIERELLIGEAKRRNLAVTDDEVNRNIAEGTLYVSLPSSRPGGPPGGPPPGAHSGGPGGPPPGGPPPGFPPGGPGGPGGPNGPPSLASQLGFESGHASVDDLFPGGFKNKETNAFDQQVYEKALKALGTRSPTEFQAWQGRELLAAKVRDNFKSTITVPDEEAFPRYVEDKKGATLDYVFVYREWVERYAVKSDPKEVDDWAKANPQKVMVPVRHILVQGEGDKLEAAREKAEGILERVKKGEDFVKLAAEFSEDPESKDKGGEYAGEMVQELVPEFQESVGKLKPGELDQKLVKTDYGFHIIKRDPATPAITIKGFRMSKSEAVAKQIATEIHAEVTAGKSAPAAITAAIAKWGQYPFNYPLADGSKVPGATTDPIRPQWKTTESFTRDGQPIMLISPDATRSIITFAFANEANAIMPAPVTTYTGSIVVQVKERKTPTKEEFDADRGTYLKKLVSRKQDEELGKWVRGLREAAKAEITIDEQLLVPRRDGGAPNADPSANASSTPKAP
jgi:parvulin-like peptidyl-prolyl isomerase